MSTEQAPGFAGWFQELRSGMSYRLWEQGGHEQRPGDVALYEMPPDTADTIARLTQEREALRIAFAASPSLEPCKRALEHWTRRVDDLTAALAAATAREGALREDAARWRPEVEKFADLMEARLRANDHKDGWQECAPNWLLMRMIGEAGELLDEMDPGPRAASAFYAAGRMLGAACAELNQYGKHLECKATPERLRNEAADVANFAMMLVDRYGGLSAAIDAARKGSPT